MPRISKKSCISYLCRSFMFARLKVAQSESSFSEQPMRAVDCPFEIQISRRARNVTARTQSGFAKKKKKKKNVIRASISSTSSHTRPVRASITRLQFTRRISRLSRTLTLDAQYQWTPSSSTNRSASFLVVKNNCSPDREKYVCSTLSENREH